MFIQVVGRHGTDLKYTCILPLEVFRYVPWIIPCMMQASSIRNVRRPLGGSYARDSVHNTGVYSMHVPCMVQTFHACIMHGK